jgi:hypothetical protein
MWNWSGASPGPLFIARLMPGSSTVLTCHCIGTDWSILISPSFERKTENGDIILWAPGRTVHASVFNTNNTDAEDAIERMIEGRPGIPVQMFDREEPGLAGHAYLLPEGDKDHRYWGLNTWTAARGSVACVTIYFDCLIL